MKPQKLNLSASSLFEQATSLHREGYIEQAEVLYQEILRIEPGHVDALHLSGAAALLRGHAQTACILIGKALALNPNLAIAHSNLGNALRDLKRPAEALASYDRALDLKPDYTKALNNRGNALQDLRRHDEALENYNKALALQPDYPEAHSNRASALCALGMHDEALAGFGRALVLKPDHVAALYGRGMTLLELGRAEEAIADFEAVLRLQPRYADAQNDLGTACMNLGRDHAALAAYEEALRIDPNHARALCNRSHVLLGLNRTEEALEACERALAIAPGLAQAHNNRGRALMRLARHEESLASYGKALEISPEFSSAQWNEALCRLKLGDFETGWKKYEWRWQTGQLKNLMAVFSQPVWQMHESLHGKRILLHHEQGLGDTLQFVRYASLVADQAAEVILVAPKPLQRLLASVKGVNRVVGPGEPLPPFDTWCPLLSLPRLFDTRVETIPARASYLRADEKNIAAWRERMAQDSKTPAWQPALRIGLAWAGNARKDNGNILLINTDARRSMHLRQLAPLAQVRGAVFYSLQKGEPAAQAQEPPDGMRLIDHTALLNDFGDTAALIMNLDLVITVDTSVAHLAGALGKPVWVMNRFDDCWRWLRGRDDSPWYPTMHLFRQQRPGGWEDVVQEITCALSMPRAGREQNR